MSLVPAGPDPVQFPIAHCRLGSRALGAARPGTPGSRLEIKFYCGSSSRRPSGRPGSKEPSGAFRTLQDGDDTAAGESGDADEISPAGSKHRRDRRGFGSVHGQYFQFGIFETTDTKVAANFEADPNSGLQPTPEWGKRNRRRNEQRANRSAADVDVTATLTRPANAAEFDTRAPDPKRGPRPITPEFDGGGKQSVGAAKSASIERAFGRHHRPQQKRRYRHDRAHASRRPERPGKGRLLRSRLLRTACRLPSAAHACAMPQQPETRPRPMKSPCASWKAEAYPQISKRPPDGWNGPQAKVSHLLNSAMRACSKRDRVSKRT